MSLGKQKSVEQSYVKMVYAYRKALPFVPRKHFTKVAKQGSKLLTFVRNVERAIKPPTYVMQTKSIREYYYDYYYYFHPLWCNKAPYYVTTIV
jgi:hypothetical protein